MPVRFPGFFNPSILPILLAMTPNRKETEKALEDLVGFIQSTRTAIEQFGNGMETFHSSFAKIAGAPQEAELDPQTPEQTTFETLPVNEKE